MSESSVRELLASANLPERDLDVGAIGECLHPGPGLPSIGPTAKRAQLLLARRCARMRPAMRGTSMRGLAHRPSRGGNRGFSPEDLSLREDLDLTESPSHDELIYDWNTATPTPPLPGRIEFDDETLRDGLQGPSSLDPPIDEEDRAAPPDERHRHPHGRPRAARAPGPRQVEDVTRLCQEIAGSRRLSTRGRTARLGPSRSDIRPIAEIVQKTGVPIETCTFIGSSPDPPLRGGLGRSSAYSRRARRRSSSPSARGST